MGCFYSQQELPQQEIEIELENSEEDCVLQDTTKFCESGVYKKEECKYFCPDVSRQEVLTVKNQYELLLDGERQIISSNIEKIVRKIYLNIKRNRHASYCSKEKDKAIKYCVLTDFYLKMLYLHCRGIQDHLKINVQPVNVPVKTVIVEKMTKQVKLEDDEDSNLEYLNLFPASPIIDFDDDDNNNDNNNNNNNSNCGLVPSF